MCKITFLPWIGNKYEQGINNKKVLVLGESHYCASPSDVYPQMTTDIITGLWDEESEHEGYKNTYTKFERALSGKPLNGREKEAVWNSIAFYNYVQSPMSEAREKPTADEFRSSEAAFFETINRLQPDCIIAWGKRLYNNLPKKGSQLPDLQLSDGEAFETWSYTLENGKTVALLQITHPSAAFVPQYWYPVMQAFINR